jgi:mRNA-degrading endonuclease RelE of RelBE toxin-antitoxin system
LNAGWTLAVTFRIQFSSESADDVRRLRAFDRQKVLEGIQLFLGREPTKVSRSRIKLMVQPFWSQYRLRIEDFRIYYDVDVAAKFVNVLRILQKTSDPTPRELP